MEPAAPDSRFKDLITYAEWGIAIGSADGITLEFVNPAYARMYGYTVEELQGQPITTVFAPSTRADLPHHVELSHQAGHRRFETLHMHRSGRIFPVLVDVTTVRDELGAVKYRIVNVQDISERKQAEQALRDSQEFFRTLFDAAAVGMAIADVNGRYVRVNKAMVDFVGYTEAELLSMCFQDITHPDDVGPNVHQRDRLLAGTCEKVQMEKRYIRKDGREVWALMVVTTVPNSNGPPQFSIGQMLDIDALKRSEQHLKESQSRLAEAQRIGQIGDYRWDVNQTFIEVSAEAHRLLRNGQNAATLTLGEVFACIHPDDLGLIEGRLAALAERPRGNNSTIRVRLTDGTQRILEWHSELERDADGRPWRVRGTLQDVTLHEENKQHLNQSREQLRLMTAHHQTQLEDERKRIARELHDELGQQLTALKMNVSLLCLRHPDQADIHVTATEMRELLDRTVTVARDVSSALHPIALDLGLRPALEWLTENFTRRYGIPCQLDADETPLPLDDEHTTTAFRIAQESLTNIARHAHAQHVCISLRSEGRCLILEIIDDGRGFVPGQSEHGKSFGLLGMQERALSAGGQLDIETMPGNGTRIRLTLPLCEDSRP